MKIAVCIKQVPTLSKIEFDYERKRIIRDGVPLEMNVFDLIALGRAVEMKEELGAEVTALTMGPPQARDVLAHALAVGADHAMLISDPAMAGSDTLATSRTLALALGQRGFDLILCGRNSADAETGQVGPELAELLDIPHVSRARKLVYHPEANSVVVERVTDDGYETLEVSLPALVTATEGLSEERWPRRRVIAEARERPVEEVKASDLSDDPSVFGAAGSPTRVADIRLLERRRLARVIEGLEPSEAATLVAEGIRGVAAANASPPTERRWSRHPQGRDKALWVVAERAEGGFRWATMENLGKARELAEELKAEVSAVLMDEASPEDAATLASYGADTVLALEDGGATHPTSPLAAAALAEAIKTRRPYAVLFASTANGRDLASRTAARLSLGLTGDCVDLEIDEEGRLVQLKPALGGNVVAPILSDTLPYMTTMRPGLLSPITREPEAGAAVERFHLPAGKDPVRLLASRREEDVRGAELERARIVLGVGKGIGGPERLAEIHRMAERLGASVAATRSVTDAGWLPKQAQVGLTGRAIAPRVYIAVGIRGAFNHMVGVQKAGAVAAINTNARHPIFQAADFGIVGDWQDYLPPLIEALADGPAL